MSHLLAQQRWGISFILIPGKRLRFFAVALSLLRFTAQDDAIKAIYGLYFFVNSAINIINRRGITIY